MKGIRNTAEVISEIQKVEFTSCTSYKAGQKSDIKQFLTSMSPLTESYITFK